MRRLLFSFLFLFASCAEQDSTSPQIHPEMTSQSQAVVDQGEPNWLVVGGSTFAELIGGSDGEPNIVTGRFVMNAQTVSAVSSGFGQWVVVGDGVLQALDDSAERLREVRTALGDNQIQFIEQFEGPNSAGWVIGGVVGQMQLLDNAGEPTNNQVSLFGGLNVISAAFGGINFLAMSNAGNIVVVDSTLGTPVNPLGVDAFPIANEGRVVVSDGDQDTDPRWIAFSESSYAPINAAGGPGAEVSTPQAVTTAEVSNSTVYVGHENGDVSVAPYGDVLTFSTFNVLDVPIDQIIEGPANFLAVGVDGKARLFDATGPLGNIQQIGIRRISGAHATTDGWWVVGEDAVARFVDETLMNPVAYTSILGGNRAIATSVGQPGTLVVGENGAVQLLDELGGTVTAPETVGDGTLHDAAWNNEVFLIVGDAGFAHLVSEQGAPLGGPITLLDGDDIFFASWSGEFWLIGGENGKVQLIRPDGQPSAPPRQIDADSIFYDAQWDGGRWMIVGERNAAAVFGFVLTDPNQNTVLTDYLLMTSFSVVEFDGREWVAGGENGNIVRVSSGGQAMGDPIKVLEENDVLSIYYNGQNLMVGGTNGAIRRVGADFIPLRSTISALGGIDIVGISWTTARGFPNGPCLSADSCFAGPCVGGLANGSCCSSACDRACESCFENDTGEPDGTCAPVVADKRPPSGAGCTREPESTCGLTGFCDGTGSCQQFGTEVECEVASCSTNAYQGAGLCDGSGSCSSPNSVSCAPYSGCSPDLGCPSSCDSDADCISGFECTNNICEEPVVEMEPEPKEVPPSDEGCCATTKPAKYHTFVFLFLIICIARRRVATRVS